MKRNYTLLLLLLATVSILAQTPEKMSYQAVLRDASNTLLTNQEVGMQISILQNTATSAAVYVETQTPTTNLNGLVSLEIGTGSTSDSFASIDWSAGPYFIKIATDPNGGSSYSITGTSQLMSVPFAMYAKTSGSSIPGPQGEPGTNGTDGTQGIQGATGTPGAAGTNGTSGTKGDTGNVGEKGDTGAQGTQGIQGATGTSGAAGADGATGAAGTNGTQGIQGDTGSVGADGAAGTNGTNGDQGIQGIQGETGTTGETGTPGTNGTNGDKGDTGIAGNKGNAGDKGDTGDQGAKGAKGDIGITGDNGDVGDKGNAGNTGDQGTQGIQGETGATGGTGAQGEQGTTGTTGSAGENGANGNNWISNILNPSPTFPGVAVGDQWLNTTSGDVFEWDGFTWNGTGNIQGSNGLVGAPGIQGETGTAGAAGTNGADGAAGTNGTNGAQGIQGETGTAGTDGTNVIGFSGDLGNAYSDYLYWDTISNSWSVGSGEVHIGQNAGESSQGSSAVAIGRDSGIDSQGDFSVAIGTFSGYKSQGSEAVAIGYKSGTNSQGSNAVAIGNLSGFSGQGDNAIAIGALSGIHQTNNSIILNATGSELNSTVSNSLYIAPIREANGPQVLTYDPITKEVTVAPASVAIGDIRGGGVVFWLDSTGLHGLVCAFSDYETEVEWGCYATDLPNVPTVPFNGGIPVGVGAEIGDGFNNTFDILQDCPTAPAALAARSLGPEWFLPSAKELNQMYIHQTTLEAVAGFEEFSWDYWSSTERDFIDAWYQRFSDGYQFPHIKNTPFNNPSVRAVRAF